MAGLDPAIHTVVRERKTWMPGSSPGMTSNSLVRRLARSDVLQARRGAALLGSKTTHMIARELLPAHGRTAGASTAMPCADRKSTRLNSSHQIISYAVFC